MNAPRSHPKFVGAVVLAALALSAAPVMGQPSTYRSYSAKFVCGPHVTPPPAELADGRYKTVVNIHNPNYLIDAPTGDLRPVFFLKKVVLSVPQGQPPLAPSCVFEEALDPDHSMQVDCAAIKAQLALSGLPATGPVEGFVVLMVGVQADVEPPFPDPPPLDVVAVYTSKPDGGAVATMDEERVPATKFWGNPSFTPCPDD